MIERVIVVRVSTKHTSLWMRQQEMKRKEKGEMAEKMGFGEIERESETEKDLGRWERSTSSPR